MSQQYHHNYSLNQEQRAMIFVYFAYITRPHPPDQGNILFKWMPLVSPYKYMHCLPKLHHLHQYTPVNRSTKRSKLTYPPHPLTTQTTNTPQFTHLEICLPFKYQPQFCYYTNGPFIPPKETCISGTLGTRKRRIWHIQPFQKSQVAKRLPRLQNILRA